MASADNDVPADDATIGDEVLLHRLVPRSQIVQDDNIGRYRPSTNAFQKSSRRAGGETDQMSVILDDALQDQFRSVAEFLDETKTVGSLLAGFVRKCCEQRVRRSPTVTDDAHGDVIGPDRKPLRLKMAREAICAEGDWEEARASA